MEENKVKTIKEIAIPIGIATGIARVVIDFIPKILNSGPAIYYSTFLICLFLEIAVIIYAIKKYKKQSSYLTVRDGLQIGVTIMLIVGIIYTTSSYVYDTYIDPSFQINTAIAWGDKFGQGDAVRERISKNDSNSSSIGIIYGLLQFSFVGFLISMIVSSILKTPKNLN